MEARRADEKQDKAGDGTSKSKKSASMQLARRMRSIVLEREKKLTSMNEEVREIEKGPEGDPNNPFNMKPATLASVVEAATKRAKFMNKTYGKLSATMLSQASHGLSEAEVKALINEECKLDEKDLSKWSKEDFK